MWRQPDADAKITGSINRIKCQSIVPYGLSAAQGDPEGPDVSITQRIHLDNTPIRRKVAQGLGFGLLGRVLLVAIQVTTTLAAARFLTPNAFGVFAFALIYVNFLSQFSDFGITSAVIQRGDYDTEVLHTAFWLKVGTGSVLSLLGVLVGLAMTRLGHPSSGLVLCVLSLSFILGALSFLPQTLLTIKLRFKALFSVSVTAASISAVCSLALLNLGFGYWAIAIAFLVSGIVSSIHFNILAFVRPTRVWRRQHAIDLIKFGRVIFITGLINFAVLYGGNFFVGIMSGPYSLGLYTMAFSISFMVVSQVGSVLVGVLFPVYSRIKNDPHELRFIFSKSVEYTCAAAVMVNVSLIILAPSLFFVALGAGSEKWYPALTAFNILCFNGIVSAILYPIAPLTVAMGRAGLQLRAACLAGAVQLALIFPAVRYFGIEGAAGVLALATLSQYLVYVPVLKRDLGFGLGDFLRHLIPAGIAGVVVFAGSAAMASTFESLMSDRNWGELLAKGVALTIAFPLAYCLLTKFRPVKEVAAFLRSLVR